MLLGAVWSARSERPEESAKPAKSAKAAPPRASRPPRAIPVHRERPRGEPTVILRAQPVRQLLSLDAAVFIALEQNPDLRRARQEVERLKGQVITVRAQALPRVSLSASYRREDEKLAGSGAGANDLESLLGVEGQSTPRPAPTPTPTPGPTPSPTPGQSSTPSASPTPALANAFAQTTSWQITLQVTQTLYAGGRIQAQIRAAKHAEHQAIFRLRDQIDTVIAKVRQQFAEALLNQSLVTVQEETVALLTRQLSDQRARYESGTIAQFDVLQAEVALANALPSLIMARNNAKISQLQLARTLGQNHRLPPEGMPYDLAGSLDLPAVRCTLEEALREAQLRRPLLKAQREAILIEVQNLIAERAGYLPTVQAQAGYTVQNDRFADDATAAVHGWFLGVQGNWNIFDGFETYGNVLQSRARIETARILYDDSVMQVDLEVRQSWLNLQQALETVVSQYKAEDQAMEAVRQATERLATGVGTQLDLLNATVALTQSRTTTLQARYQFIAASADFDRAIGMATEYNQLFRDPLAEGMPKRRVWKTPPPSGQKRR